MNQPLSYCQVMIGRAMTGLLGLPEIMARFAEEGIPADASDLGARLVEAVSEHNWVPPAARSEYEKALAREYRRYSEAQGEGGRVWRDPRRERTPWYPTIFTEKCDGCRECLPVCPRDVLGWDDEENVAIVLEPYECATGCERCARACKRGAIIMPARAVLHQRIDTPQGRGMGPGTDMCAGCTAGDCRPCED